MTLFDTADSYGLGASEELLGQALGSRRHIRRAVEASLRRLGTDWIDLYQYHPPDPMTPLEETLAALHELVAEGKVRYLGSSNLAGWPRDCSLARTAGTRRPPPALGSPVRPLVSRTPTGTRSRPSRRMPPSALCAPSTSRSAGWPPTADDLAALDDVTG